MDLNTCIETTQAYHTIAYYSHLIPVAIAMALSIFILVKTKYSLLSKIFFYFNLTVSIWLLGDVVLWTAPGYHLISFLWAPLDYINVLFYLFGVYFFVVFVTQKDISRWQKIVLFALSLPAWLITVSGHSITSFNQTVCEANNNDLLTKYKLGIEIFSMLAILYFGVKRFWHAVWKERWQIITVALGMILFLSVFSVTEYIASTTGIYEINLYGLFVLPIFLIIIIFAAINQEIFKLKSIATRFLIFVLLIMVGSQFFFLKDSTDKVLTTITFIISIMLGWFLNQNVKKEIAQLEKIEKLAKQLQVANTNISEANTKLKELDKQKSEFVSFASHQLRSPMTAMKGYASMMFEGDYGPIPENLRAPINIIYQSTETLISLVEDYLNISRIELGTMRYNTTVMDLKDIAKEAVNEERPNVEKRALTLNLKLDESQKYMVSIDRDKFKQVLMNLVDNAIKYTPLGSITVELSRVPERNVIRYSVTDTGIGLSAAIIPKLFQKWSRADNARAENIKGTGLGLFVAKQMTEAHKGKIWAESPGEGKGSRFIVELPEVK